MSADETLLKNKLGQEAAPVDAENKESDLTYNGPEYEYNGLKYKKINIMIAGVGHVDHGKTTLVASILRMLTTIDKKLCSEIEELKEEMKFRDYSSSLDKSIESAKRGITIDSASTRYVILLNELKLIVNVTHVDAPGHQDFVKNMIVGTTYADAAILVVAMTDGVMQQTSEHLTILKNSGVKNIAVFYNKADTFYDDQGALTEDGLAMLDGTEVEVRDKCKSLGSNIIAEAYGSGLLALEGDITAEEIDLVKNSHKMDEKEICNKLNSLGKHARARWQIRGLFVNLIKNYKPKQSNPNAPLFMQVSDIHSIQGRGKIYVGTALGQAKIGDKVTIFNGQEYLESTITDAQEFHSKVDKIRHGQSVGILLGRISGGKGDIEKGNIIMLPEADYRPVQYIEALVELDSNRKNPIKTGYQPTIFAGLAGVTCTVYVLSIVQDDGSEIESNQIKVGQEARVIIKINQNKQVMFPPNHDTFSVREGQRTVMNGRFNKEFMIKSSKSDQKERELAEKVEKIQEKIDKSRGKKNNKGNQ